MRPILSWLLLCLVSFHWIGGHVYFKVINIEQEKRIMSVTEASIASAIQEETGISTEIEIINDATIEAIGYSNTFVFNKKINGQSHQYTINSNSKRTIKETIVNCQSDLPNDLQNKIFGKLFPKLFNSIATIDFNPLDVAVESNISSQVTTMKTLFHHSIPLPPPNFSC